MPTPTPPPNAPPFSDFVFELLLLLLLLLPLPTTVCCIVVEKAAAAASDTEVISMRSEVEINKASLSIFQ